MFIIEIVGVVVGSCAGVGSAVVVQEAFKRLTPVGASKIVKFFVGAGSFVVGQLAAQKVSEATSEALTKAVEQTAEQFDHIKEFIENH